MARMQSQMSGMMSAVASPSTSVVRRPDVNMLTPSTPSFFVRGKGLDERLEHDALLRPVSASIQDLPFSPTAHLG